MLDNLGAEDFGSFSDLVPGAMFSLGALVEGDPRQHHNPRFDIDERSLPLGAAILAETALRYLSAVGWNNFKNFYYLIEIYLNWSVA